MSYEIVPAGQLVRLRERIADRLGLDFPERRLADFERGVVQAAHELRFDSLADCVRELLSVGPTARQLDVLASHLTIGETYFFRDAGTFQVLADDILPRLIYSRRGGHQRLRLWSAGCSSGEEAYSLAILVHRMLPDLRDWHVTILGTDINPNVLRKAEAGVFGEWSFRGVPSGIREQYFERMPDQRYAIRPDIKKLVTFERLNLATGEDLPGQTGANAMDIVLCRNVLMYFTPAHMRKAVRRLADALVGGGWLIVSPSETSQELFDGFATVNFPGAILYQKRGGVQRSELAVPTAPDREHATHVWAPSATARPQPEWTPHEPRSPEIPPPSLPSPASLYEQGRYADAVAAIFREDAQPQRRDRLSLLVRALANQGKLADALSWSHRWIETHKLDAAAYYMRAVVLSEQGRADEARRSFQQAVYLEPDFVLAHFALGTLARRVGRDDADRHFANALRGLARLEPDQVVPESDGLTAARLTDTILARARHG